MLCCCCWRWGGGQGSFTDLDCRLRKQDAVICHDTDWVTVDLSKPSNECSAIQRLELVEPAVVDDPRNHIAHIKRLLQVGSNNAIELFRVVARRSHRLVVDRNLNRKHSPETPGNPWSARPLFKSGTDRYHQIAGTNRKRLRPVAILDNAPGDRKRVVVVLGIVIGNTCRGANEGGSRPRAG